MLISLEEQIRRIATTFQLDLLFYVFLTNVGLLLCFQFYIPFSLWKLFIEYYLLLFFFFIVKAGQTETDIKRISFHLQDKLPIRLTAKLYLRWQVDPSLQSGDGKQSRFRR